LFTTATLPLNEKNLPFWKALFLDLQNKNTSQHTFKSDLIKVVCLGTLFANPVKKIKMSFSEIQSLLGNQAAMLLDHHSRKIGQTQINTPSPNTVEEVFISTGRNNKVLRNIATMVD